MESQHKTGEEKELKDQETHLKELVSKLKATTEVQALKTLEHEVATAEGRLSRELQRIFRNGQSFVSLNRVRRDAKSEVLAHAVKLEQKAQEAHDELVRAHRSHEAQTIQADLEHIKKLVAELKASEASADITHLVKGLAAAESRLEKEIARVHSTHTDKLKDALLKRAQVLLSSAEHAKKELTKTNKEAEIKVIAAEEAAIVKLVEEVNAYKGGDDTKLTKLEKDLKTAEDKLAQELRKIRQ